MPSASVNFVVTTAMHGCEIAWIVCAAVPLLDKVVRRVRARLSADVADATVAGDHRRRQLAPRLRTVGAVDAVAANALCRCPAVRTVDGRLPWHFLIVILFLFSL